VDRNEKFLACIHRRQGRPAADLLAKAMWIPSHGLYWHVGEVDESSKGIDWEFSGWRWEPISATRLAAWIPLLALFAWLGLLLMA
jgi:hypothetical protein